MCTKENYEKCPACIYINGIEDEVKEIKMSVTDSVKVLNQKMDRVKNALIAAAFALSGTLAGGIILFVLSQGGK